MRLILVPFDTNDILTPNGINVKQKITPYDINNYGAKIFYIILIKKR